MYLFGRRGRIAPGRNRDAITWATEVTEKVNEVVEIPVSLYTTVFGPEVGTLVWSVFVPDLVTLERNLDRLQADASVLDLADRGAEFTVGGLDDTLAQLIHGEPDPTRDIEYVVAVQAVCASRNLGRGIEVGVEIAQMAEKITGSRTLFASAVTGPYGGVAWFTGFESIQELESQERALAADAGWIEFLDREAGTAYAENQELTTNRIYRRLI
jgi:hypothetical protein